MVNQIQIQFKINPSLYLRDPDSSELGRNIIRHSIDLMIEIGLEEFTFRKLAAQAGTTEASIYRYFENKQRLLSYIVAWWWTWLDYQIVFHTNNVISVEENIRIIVRLLTVGVDNPIGFANIDKDKLHKLVLTESNKAYMNRHVTEDNKQQIFKPYKDLCARIAGLFQAYNPGYRFPRSLASTLLEMAHLLPFFKRNLPSLTDYPGPEGDTEAAIFLEKTIFAALDAGNA